MVEIRIIDFKFRFHTTTSHRHVVTIELQSLLALKYYGVIETVLGNILQKSACTIPYHNKIFHAKFLQLMNETPKRKKTDKYKGGETAISHFRSKTVLAQQIDPFFFHVVLSL